MTPAKTTPPRAPAVSTDQMYPAERHRSYERRTPQNHRLCGQWHRSRYGLGQELTTESATTMTTYDRSASASVASSPPSSGDTVRIGDGLNRSTADGRMCCTCADIAARVDDSRIAPGDIPRRTMATGGCCDDEHCDAGPDGQRRSVGRRRMTETADLCRHRQVSSGKVHCLPVRVADPPGRHVA